MTVRFILEFLVLVGALLMGADRLFELLRVLEEAAPEHEHAIGARAEREIPGRRCAFVVGRQ
jgi:hypothetical protein